MFCAVSAVTALVAYPPRDVTRFDVGLDAGAAAGIGARNHQDARDHAAALVADRADDPRHRGFDGRLVVALAHDADDGFGAGFAHQDAPVAAERLLRGLDRSFDRGAFEDDRRRRAVDAHVFENLRHACEHVRRLARRHAFADDHRQHLKRRDEPRLPRRREIAQDDVAGLLAAEVDPVLAHGIDDVAVADRGAQKLEADGAEEALEPEVGT